MLVQALPVYLAGSITRLKVGSALMHKLVKIYNMPQGTVGMSVRQQQAE
jgi:hypothetical protein